jgi:hypothetical protein
MSNEAHEAHAAGARNRPRAVGQGRRQSTVLPSGYSWLSVPVPTEALDHLHIQARRSGGMSFQEYMARFCLEAFPYGRKDSGTATAPESAPESAPEPTPESAPESATVPVH